MILRINGEKVDLGPNVVEITKQLFDFSDITKRYLGRTNRFIIPNSNFNSNKLQSPSTVNADNESFEQYYNGTLLDSNIRLFKGQGIFEEYNGENYLQLTEDAKLLFDSLNGKLKDLDFESSDFTYNTSAYNSLKKENSKIWIWSAMSQHVNKDASKGVLSGELAFTRPWFRVRKIWDAIFSNAGWTYEFRDTITEFENSQISSNHKQFFVTDYQKTLDETISPGGSPTNITDLDTNDFEESSITVSSTVINIGQHVARFILRGPVVITGNVKIIFEGLSSPLGDDVFKQEFILDSTQTSIDLKTDKIKTEEVDNNIQIKIDGTGTIEFQDTLLYTIIEEESLGNFEDDLLQGFRVKAHDNLQNISQIDFLNNLWVQYGMLFNVDPYLKKLTFFKLQDIKKLNAADWSDKMVQKSESIKGKIGDYAQTNYLKYSNDDETGENVGRWFFNVNDSTLDNEKDIIELYWGASNEVEIDSETQADMPIYTDTERDFDANPRICTYRDGTTAAISQFDEISWFNLKTNYYSVLDSLLRIRFIECLMTLTRSDFVSYDFSKPVYIDYFKSYFLVQRPDSYIPGVPVKCELIKFK